MENGNNSNNSNSRKDVAQPRSAVDNIEDTARETASFDAYLLHRKGVYTIDEKVIPIGTKYLVCVPLWTIVWRKYDSETVVKRSSYTVAKGERAPDREDLDDWPGQETKDNKDEIEQFKRENWPTDDDGEPFDPWAKYYLLPMENLETHEQVVFSTRAIGGYRAVSDLAREWTRHVKRLGNGLPKVKIEVTDMPSKAAKGSVKRPLFTVIGWEDQDPSDEIAKLPPSSDGDEGGEFGSGVKSRNEMNDDIPF